LLYPLSYRGVARILTELLLVFFCAALLPIETPVALDRAGANHPSRFPVT
jgi:hypothetical protein